MIIQVLDTTREISSLSDLKDIAATQSGEDLSEWTVTNVCSKRQKIEPGLINMQDLIYGGTWGIIPGMLLAGGELFIICGGRTGDGMPCSTFPLR